MQESQFDGNLMRAGSGDLSAGLDVVAEEKVPLLTGMKCRSFSL
jgi:hypothetical protein